MANTRVSGTTGSEDIIDVVAGDDEKKKEKWKMGCKVNLHRLSYRHYALVLALRPWKSGWRTILANFRLSHKWKRGS